MRRLRAWLVRSTSVFRMRAHDREFDAEVESHLQLQVDDSVRTGMTPAEARRQAILELGGIEQTRQRQRDRRGLSFVGDVFRDARQALRWLWRRPAFAAAAVATLALGIGANAGVFAVVDAVLLRPLPYPRPDRLVRLWETNPSQGIAQGEVSPGSFVDWQTRSRSVDAIGLYVTPRDWFVGMSGEPLEPVRVSTVTPGFFRVLGVPPLRGRTLRRESEQAPPFDEVILSYGLWQGRFAGRADIVGRRLSLEDHSTLTVVGVMPAGFEFPANTEAWREEPFLHPITGGERLTRYYECIARLRDGVTVARAQSEFASIADELAVEWPDSNAGVGVQVEPLLDSMVGHLRRSMLLVLGVVVCVLLIACANVVGLLLARAAARRQETALRSALGASRLALLRRDIIEAAALATLGAAVGLLLGHLAIDLFRASAPAGIPRLNAVTLGGPVLGAVALVFVAVVLSLGVAPAVLGARIDLRDVLAGASKSSTRVSDMSKWIVAAQIALTLSLLIGANALLRSFVRLREVDLGFQSAGVLTADLRLPTGRYADRRPWARLRAEYEGVLDAVRRIPGVEGVGGITGLPLTETSTVSTFWMDDGTGRRPDATRQFEADIRVVTPDYFPTMHIPLASGRVFDASDRLSDLAFTNPETFVRQPHGVVVVNRVLATRYWPVDAQAVGVRIRMFDHWAVASSTIVGVVGDVRSEAVAQAAPPTIYVPFGEIPGFQLSLAIRTGAAPDQFDASLRAVSGALDPQLIVSPVRRMSAIVGDAVRLPKFAMLLVLSFALTALVLTAVGVYGVVAFYVGQRMREIGIRMALGATPATVTWLVLKQGMWPAILGGVGGAAAAGGLSRVIRGVLFETTPAEPAIVFASAVVVGLVSLAAAVTPVLRAARTDAIGGLGEE